MSLGISKGSLGQSKAFLVAAISSAPKGAPCVFEVPAKFGAPNPIVVLQAIIEGFQDFLLLISASSISS